MNTRYTKHPMPKNVHKVPAHHWKTWSKAEQAAFNRLWCHLHPGVLPKSVAMTLRQFNVLRFNTCFTVANMMKVWRGEW